jgi:hypothetical protein
MICAAVHPSILKFGRDWKEVGGGGGREVVMKAFIEGMEGQIHKSCMCGKGNRASNGEVIKKGVALALIDTRGLEVWHHPHKEANAKRGIGEIRDPHIAKAAALVARPVVFPQQGGGAGIWKQDHGLLARGGQGLSIVLLGTTMPNATTCRRATLEITL